MVNFLLLKCNVHGHFSSENYLENSAMSNREALDSVLSVDKMFDLMLILMQYFVK